MSKIFILITVLTITGTAALVISYTRRSSPEIQPIKLPVGTPKGNELSAGQEEISIPRESGELEEVKVIEIEKIKDEIKTGAKEEIIKYQEESFYSEEDFSVILENQNEFKSQLIEGFKKRIIGVTAENCKVDLSNSKKSATLRCDIREAMYAPSKYNMHFLLGNWPFDLYQFKKYQKKLVYDGEIDRIPTSIVFEFPYILSHCHEHVWPR